MNDSDDDSRAVLRSSSNDSDCDSRAVLGSSSPETCAEATTGVHESPDSPTFSESNSSALSASFSRSIPAPHAELSSSTSSAIEADVCKSKNAIYQFAISTAVSLLELKSAAQRLGLVITMGSRTKGGDARIGFGLKSSVRRKARAIGQYPLTFFKFNERKDGFLHAGNNI